MSHVRARAYGGAIYIGDLYAFAAGARTSKG